MQIQKSIDLVSIFSLVLEVGHKWFSLLHAHLVCNYMYYGWCILIIVLIPLVLALQDNTNELFELIYSDKVESPVTSTVATATDGNCTHNTESNHDSIVTGGGDDVNGDRREVQLGWQDEVETFSDFMVNVNFTPTPHASLQPKTALEKRVEEKKKQDEHEEMDATVVTQLLDLLQQ